MCCKCAENQDRRQGNMCSALSASLTNAATDQVEMKTSQECSSQSLAFKCIEFCSTLSNQGLRYAFSLKIRNFNFSLKSDNNTKKRSRPPSYIRRQKLRRELQKKNPAQGSAKETKSELLKKELCARYQQRKHDKCRQYR